MAQLGEVSVGRQVLEGFSLAAGDLKTMNALKDPKRRPAVHRDRTVRVAPGVIFEQRANGSMRGGTRTLGQDCRPF